MTTEPEAATGELELADWRRRVAELYADVRATESPQQGHAIWRAGRDQLFQTHSQSPLAAGDRLHAGLPYAPYDPALRWDLAVQPVAEEEHITIDTAAGETTRMRRVGNIVLPDPIGATLAVWWLEQYGGGLFIPIRDQTAGETSYGGGRYLLDTAKGADLGGSDGRLTVDLNFLYHPSCRYDPQWQCPLAPPANRIDAAIQAGEQL